MRRLKQAITDYISFCIDNVVKKKQVLHFPNNKPHITRDVKACINKKKLAFKNKDRLGVTAAKKELNILLKKARGRQRLSVEKSFNSKDNK